MLTPYLPYPPSSGGQIRSYNLIKQLSKKHKITLCSLIKYDEEKKYINELKPFCKEIHVFKRPEKPFALSNILKTGFSSYPLLVIRNFSKTERKTLEKLVQEHNFDIIHAETFYVSPHIPQTNIPVVLVDQTIEYQVYKHFVDHFKVAFLKPLLSIDVRKLKYWEIYYWKKAARVIAVSDEDAKVMKSLVNNLKVEMVPNGVGEDLMEEVPTHFNYQILFIGNYLWLQNAEAAKILATQVFPLIRQKVPEATLHIVGQNINKIGDLNNIEGLVLKELAVDDTAGVKEAYQKSGMLIAPLYGPGGTRLKILGAMAARLPVVTTKVGIAGIGEAGECYLEGETAEELAREAVKLFGDKKLYKRIADNARALVKDNYSYEKVAEKLDKVYQEVING